MRTALTAALVVAALIASGYVYRWNALAWWTVTAVLGVVIVVQFRGYMLRRKRAAVVEPERPRDVREWLDR